jgi:hypothetical protein
MNQAPRMTAEDIRAYRRELSARRIEDDPAVKGWDAARRLTWVALLASSFLIYYLVSTINEALTLPQLMVSVPANRIGPGPRPPDHL